MFLGRKLSISHACFLLLLSASGCRKPYNPPAIASPNSYLVVEGVIVNGSGPTTIKLSRTVNLSAINVNNPVSGAAVTVQGSQNVSYPLKETTPGTYVSALLNLDNTQSYRLSINTGSEQYVSAYVPVLNSPTIDSVGYTTTANSLNIYSNTEDPTNTVKYYRWDYIETWIYHSTFYSSYISNGDTVLTRTVAQEINTCWPSDTASTIILNSTAKLSKAVIAGNPITSIASTSQKIADEYSIFVRQYALTADAYTFWQNMKQNSEQLGSIFDPQPSQINGNIHSVSDPNEAVIGYISVGSVASKRIFIYNQQLPAWLPPQQQCGVTNCLYSFLDNSVVINQVDEFINYDKGAADPLIPVDVITTPAGVILGYTASTPACVDCTLYGPNVQPSFWQYQP
jgi:hypothetical protein